MGYNGAKEKMRKILFLCLTMAIAVMIMPSCRTTINTSKQQYINTTTTSALYADLDVSSKKISYGMEPSKAVARGGYENIINTAVQEALKQNGGGDVLVEMRISADFKRTFWGHKKVTYVRITGYPATYKNFRSADDETLKEILKAKYFKDDRRKK